MQLKGKKIVLGITGSIAAYKAAILVRMLVRAGAEVQVVMTPSAKEFITPLTLSTLSGRPVLCDFFCSGSGVWNSHVELGIWADAMIVAPATASTIGKMSHGIADNLLVTTYLSMRAPVFVAPAMDMDMYSHATTAHNLSTLRNNGNYIIEPGSGELASHLSGKGRMQEPEYILSCLNEFFSCAKPLAGRKILITAGPTYEKIDPVRFIGNYSSGKMGFAIANECAVQGADVTLISGPVALPTPHPSIKRVDVESAQQMYDASTKVFPHCDAAILCAAVADYSPVTTADKKIKRTATGMTLELKSNPDIAAELGRQKSEKQVLAGFALETNNGESHAKEKLEKKNLDFIVLNSLEDAGAGFAVDTNKITIIDKETSHEYSLKSKKDVAHDIVSYLKSLLLFLLLFIAMPQSHAQELNATVNLNSSKVQGTNTEVFTVLGDALTEFINNRKWTNYAYEDYEKIACNFTFVVDSYSDDGSFTCSLMVQASRPIFGSTYSSTIFQYEDKAINFSYQPYDRLDFNEDNLDNNLTATIAFYAYIIIGMDMDSMGELGGSDFLNRALNIANNAQMLSDPGWRAGSNENNRYTVIDDYMNGAMEPLRRLMYKYHRLGLDAMFKNVDEGRKVITECITMLKTAYDNRPLAYITKLFTEYKKEELVNIYSNEGGDEEKNKVVEILFEISPAQSDAWDKIKKSTL